LLDIFGRLDAKIMLEKDKEQVIAGVIKEQVGGQATGGK
jgi:hypothetical protein